jgi:putative ABC transport system substrate-binding protein
MDQGEIEQILNRFVVNDVDLILVFPTEPVIATKTAVQETNIPVVFALAGIEGNTIIETVSRPGGNITGVRYPGPDLVVKRFEILLDIAPSVKRLYIPYDPDYPNDLPALQALRPVASAAGVTLMETPVNSLEDIRASLQAKEKMTDIGIDAIQILPEALTQSPAAWSLISGFAERHNIPLVGSALASADSGGAFSYCVNFTEVGKLAAPLADKILKGTPAGDILVVTPEAHLRINYKRSRKLGLKVSESLMSLASEIIR